MPKCGYGNVLDDTPQLLEEDIGQFEKEDVIAGPLTVKRKPRERKFIVCDYGSVFEFFNKVKNIC
jgi:hypothetical protein